MTNHMDIMEKVKGLPAQIGVEIDGLSEEQLCRRAAEGAWSIKEVCGHLRDDSEVWRRRLQLMISQIDPVLPAYDQEALVREHAYQDAGIGAVLGDFRRLRAEMADSLAALAENAWERVGQHPNWGRLTIREGMERMVQHTEGHLDQVRDMKEKATAI